MSNHKTYNHTNSKAKRPYSLIELDIIRSEEQILKIISKPTKRYIKKLELEYLYCPDCESQEIYRNGKSQKGTQRFMCKMCKCQFVAQFDAVFPQSQRRSIFEKEFDGNLKPTGFDKIGSGRKKYWAGAKMETLQMLESHAIRVRANKIIKADPIKSDRDYRILLEFLVHEAYQHLVS